MSLARAFTLAELIKSFIGPCTVAEIGVFRGETSEAILKHCENLTLHMVDPWKAVDKDTSYYQSGDPCAKWSQEKFDQFYQEALDRTEPYKLRRRVHRTSSDKLQFMSNFPLKLDGVFIDAAHDYENVVRDINLFWPKIENGGFMAGHDYQPNGKIPHIRGVKKAVDEFAKKRGFNIGTGPGMVWWFWKD